MKNKFLNYIFLLFFILSFQQNVIAQKIIRQDFENEIFQKTQDTSFKPSLWKKYIRTRETGECAPTNVSAIASAELSTEFARNGKQSGKLILDVSNGGSGHKAMFRNTLIQKGTVLTDSKDECWIAFSCYLPDTGAMTWLKDSVPELIFQLHNDIVASPMVAIYSENDKFFITYRYADTDPHLTLAPLKANIKNKQPWSGELPKGQWLDWVFHIKFSPLTPDGFLEVWLNKGSEFEKLTKKKDIRIGYPCSEKTDLDIGIYKWSWKCPTTSPVKSRMIYFDEISIGNQDANFENMTSHLLLNKKDEEYGNE
jgi:hypothetical protein